MDYFRNFISQSAQEAILHLTPFARRVHTGFQVEAIGFLPNKRSVIDTFFHSVNFSFILSGSGFYSIDGQRVTIEAPYVISQKPNAHLYYGPDEQWKEFFIVYNQNTLNRFISSKLYDPAEPQWPMGESVRFTELLHDIWHLCNQLHAPFTVDKIDLSCQQLLLESRSNRVPRHQSRELDLVEIFENIIRNDPAAPLQLDAFARKNGMHPSTLRRYWNKTHSISPVQLQTRCRLQTACQYLVQTDLPVAQIAYKLGFNDPLYFSRKFTEQFNMTATAYRKTNKLPFELE